MGESEETPAQPRTVGASTHYARCASPECPCYLDGKTSLSAENEVLRGIIDQLLAGYEPHTSDGGWWRVFHNHWANPPEREGHPFTEGEAAFFAAREATP